MDENRPLDGDWWWKGVCLLALVSGLASLAVYVAHVPDFFMGDDFELAGDALAGTSPFEPVASHLRPMLRLHFLLYRWLPSATVFGALSVALHLLACGAVFLALGAIYGKRVALPTALLLFSSFLANEVVFWASSVGILYCTIFGALSLWCFVRGRLAGSYVLLGAAALSYELWIVLPLLFLFHFRRPRELIVPYAMVGSWLALHLMTFGLGSASSYGGFSLVDLPARFSVYAFRLLSPLAGSPGIGISLLLSALLLSLFALPRYRFPGVLYVGSALLFSLSAHVSSRFYYFPSLALILVLALGLDSSRRGVRVVAAVLALYLAAASPWINYLDGADYSRKAELHRELYDAFESRIDRMVAGESGVVANRLGPERLASLTHSRVGRPKLIFVRGPAMGGMIYPDDAVRMTLWDRAERPLEGDCSGKTIEVGRGELRSTYCFRIAPR